MERRGQLNCDGTRTETRFRLSAKRTSPFNRWGASVQSNTGSRCVRISGSNAGYTMFRGSVKGTGYPLHWPVSPSLPLPCVTVCHHISTGVYRLRIRSDSLTTPFGSYPCGINIIRIAAGCFRSSTRCRLDTRMCRVLCGQIFLVADSHGPICASRLGATRL